jgi:hypothetical protein
MLTTFLNDRWRLKYGTAAHPLMTVMPCVCSGMASSRAGLLYVAFLALLFSAAT